MVDFGVSSIKAELHTLVIGREIKLYPQVGSTNDLAREDGRRGEAEGLVLLTEEQIKGRGRLGRTWTAPPQSSILCSLLLRPRFSADSAFYLTIAAGVAIYRAVARLSAADKPQFAIKWPNDILVNGRKVCGILSESEFSGGEWSFAVVGFGINVNLEGEDLERLREIAPQATSLSHELGYEPDRVQLLTGILTEFEGLYLALQGGQFSPVYEAWVKALETVGKQVSVHEAGSVLKGQALRVDGDGALIIRTESGTIKRVLAGDVI